MPVALPIGPYHPALKENTYFRLEVEGERIVNADLKIGYSHRGIEWLAARRTYHQDIFLCERVCGICSNAHSTCFCQTVEDLAQIEVSDRAKYLRVIVAELERLHSHFLWFGVAMHVIGFDTAFMHMWKDREIIMRMIESITGKRVNHGFNTIGGTRRDFTPSILKSIEDGINTIEKAADRIRNTVTRDRLVKKRALDIGYLSVEDAKRISVVGPTARASAINVDIRRDDPYAAYSELDWNVIVQDEGDALARVVVRLLEIYESIRLIRQALKSLPSGPTSTDIGQLELPVSEACDRVEAPRGELFYFMKSNGTNIPERVKIRTPSYMNNAALTTMLIGNSTADAPLIIASIDPCYSCTDRVAIVNAKNGEITYVTMEELSRKKAQ